MRSGQALYIIHREKALAVGFTKDDISTYIDMIGAWLYSVGITDFAYGSVNKTGEPRDVFEDCIAIYINLPKELPEEVETILGAMEMNQGLGAYGPLVLHLQDPVMMKVTLKAWSVRQTFHRERLERVAKAASEVMRAARGNDVVIPNGTIGA